MERDKYVKQFIQDRHTYEAVKSFMLDDFLSESFDEDVHITAAKKIAINLMIESFKKMERLKSESKNIGTGLQVGL